MVKKSFPTIVLFLFVSLLLTSIASSQFMRLTGGSGYGYGYGYGYGEGYGWDYIDEETGHLFGYRHETEGLEANEYGYGYGEGFLGSDLVLDEETGQFSFDVDDIGQFIQNAAVYFTDLEIREDGGYISEMTFLTPVSLSIGDNVTIEIEEGTVLTGEDQVLLYTTEGDETVFKISGTTDVSVTNLLSGYTAINGGAVQFGFPDVGLIVSPAISISINVGSDRSGQTLRVLRQAPGSSTWSYIAECVVSGEGLCTFSTDHLSSFTVANYTAPSVTPTVEVSRSSSFIRPSLSKEVTNIKFATKSHCYRLKGSKIQILAKSSCYSRVYNKQTRKYTEVLKSGVEPISSLVRLNRSSSIYLIKGQCKSPLSITNWRTLVATRRVKSMTAKQLLGYSSCPVSVK